jgi:hypothetical protein
MIVADTNLLAYFVIPGAATPDAEYVRAKDNDWVAPVLLRFEWMNIVAQQLRPYDLEFVRLAMTADQKLIDAFPGVAVNLKDFGR